jgi:serine/threonine protein kinase
VLRRCLGAGSFGIVYLADQMALEVPLRQVALKLFLQGLVTRENARQHLNDAMVLMRLQSEPGHREAGRHLVTVLDAGLLGEERGGERREQAYVAMEYVPGCPLPGGGTAWTLEDLIRAYRPVPVELALRWMTQVLRAVAWMHTLDTPVLHCDIKPDNVLADGPGHLKVADFGLAQLALGGIGLHGGAGALGCQAPETLAGVEPTPASDVYSLGLLLHEILAGRSPLAQAGREEAALGDMDGQVRAQIEARWAGIPPLTAAANRDLTDHPLVAEIVSRCLRFRAPERYANAALLLRDIEAYAAGSHELSVAPPARDDLGDAPELARLIAEAEALARQGRRARALARAEEALAEYAGSVAAHACLARLCLTPQDWKRAVSLCGAARALDGISRADGAMLLELSARAYDAGRQRPLAARMRALAAQERKGGQG